MLHRRAPRHAASVSGQVLNHVVPATGLEPNTIYFDQDQRTLLESLYLLDLSSS
jgi:hypothetical protein